MARAVLVGSNEQMRNGDRSRSDRILRLLTNYGTVISVFVLFVLFAIISPQFLSVQNIFYMLRSVAMLGIVTTGLTVCVAAGEFDLSVGSLMSLSGILTTGFIVFGGQPVVIAILIGLLSGIVLGAVNGFLVSFLRVPSLITTLGMSAIALGINYGYSDGASVYGSMPQTFLQIGQGYIWIVPIPLIIAIAVMGVGFIFLERSKLGRHINATGANPVSARLVGLNIRTYRFIGLTLSGCSAALAGIILSAYLGTGQPNAGQPYLLSALTAVFVGMSTIRPGQANIGGTIVGVLLLGILSNGLNLVGTPFFVQSIIKGSILVVAVAIAAMRQELRFF